MKRRELFTRLGVIAAAVALAPKVRTACSDCERLFSTTFTVPEAFDQQQGPGYVEMARQAVHELAIREGISHDEAGLRLWWQAFPSVTTAPATAYTFIKDRSNGFYQLRAGEWRRIVDGEDVGVDYRIIIGSAKFENDWRSVRADLEARDRVLPDGRMIAPGERAWVNHTT